MAKSVLRALFALPLAELVAFILVAAWIGFAWALALIAASSFAGMLVLRHAGGSHVARMRGVLQQGSFTTLQADGAGTLTLLAGFLLLVPGFITSAIGVILLITPLRRLIGWLIGIKPVPAQRGDGVVDLEPEQWHQVPDPALPDRRDDEPR